MIRVFHIISHFELGGAERVAASIAKSGSEGIEYHIVEVLRGNSDFTRGFIAELQQAGVHCHRSLMPGFRWHFVAERIAAVLFPLRMLWLWLRYRPHVVHAHTEVPDMCVYASLTVMPWLGRRMRFVRTIHNTCLWSGLKRFSRKVERMYQRLGANVAISKSVLENYTREYSTTPPIIYNGVEEQPQQPYDKLIAGKTNILFAGRLEEQKGITHLIYIIKALQDMPQYHFHVIGSGKLRPMVEQELGGLPNVSLRPPVFGLASRLASFSYMLMPSEFEGLPLMSVEASMAGLPVICSDCPGLCETVPDRWPLQSRGNSHAEYERIFRQVIPRADRGSLSAQAREFARSHFSVSKMQQEYERIYRYNKPNL